MADPHTMRATVDQRLTGARQETVLVVDDDSSVRRLVGLALELEGFSVVDAADGEAALAGAGEHHPQAVVLDGVLPGLSGLEVCRRLHQCAGRPPVVIMITGRSDLADRLAAFESGVDDYVIKPVRVIELVERVKTLIDRRLLLPSRLLGGPQVAEELDRRVRAGQTVGVALADVRGVTSFARRYSFPRAERLLSFVGDQLVRLADDGRHDVVVGRLAGEEFIVAGDPAGVADLTNDLLERFTAGVGRFYDPADATRGFIEVIDRTGTLHRHRLVHLAVGVTESRPSRPLHHLELLGRASEMARHARTHGPVAADRRLA